MQICLVYEDSSDFPIVSLLFPLLTYVTALFYTSLLVHLMLYAVITCEHVVDSVVDYTASL